MLANGIVVDGKISTNNTIKIRIPQIFDNQEIDAIVCYDGKTEFNYKAGTSVILGFLYHNPSNPVVLGTYESSALSDGAKVTVQDVVVRDNGGNEVSIASKASTDSSSTPIAMSGYESTYETQVQNTESDSRINQYTGKPYSNSELISMTNISPNKTNGRKYNGQDKIDTITIHCIAGQKSAERIGEIFSKTSRKASCNYGIGHDGKIIMCVEEKDRSWCTSTRANDYRAITFQVASESSYKGSIYATTAEAFSSMLCLIYDICVRNGFKRVHFPKGLMYKDLEKLNKANTVSKTQFIDNELKKQPPNTCLLTVHKWFEDKPCPGKFLHDRLKDGCIENIINYLLSENYTPRNDINFFKDVCHYNDELRQYSQDLEEFVKI